MVNILVSTSFYTVLTYVLMLIEKEQQRAVRLKRNLKFAISQPIYYYAMTDLHFG